MPDLILVPTPMELQRLSEHVDLSGTRWQWGTCGWGPITAAAKTMAAIAEHQPQHVLLVGIAGTYDSQQLPVGSACCVRKVHLDGFGAGSGDQHQTAESLGWPSPIETTAGDHAIPLPSCLVGLPTHDLLTVCAASTSDDEASRRRERFPGVKLEDMEGYAVAVACSLSGVSLSIIRGISNRAGDRQISDWKIDQALATAAKWTQSLIDDTNP